MTATGTVDQYIAGLPPVTGEIVTEVRRRVHGIRPDVTEVLRYGMPTFQVEGRSRVHVAGWARHVSIYPVPADPDLTHDVAPYLAGEGTLKFPLSQAVPWPTVDRILRALLA